MADMLTSQEVARQVKLSRELIARLETEKPTELYDMAVAIGNLEARLALLCDVVDQAQP